ILASPSPRPRRSPSSACTAPGPRLSPASSGCWGSGLGRRTTFHPRTDVRDEVLASTGFVGREASEWWGSSQAALSVAIWSRTSDVHVSDERYTTPLHNLVEAGRSWPLRRGCKPVLLHYHYLAEAQYQEHFRNVLGRIGCSSDVVRWIEDRLPISRSRP